MQDKHLKFLIVVFLLFLSYLGSVPVTSNNDLTAGTSFTYKVNDYSIDLKVNGTEVKINSFSIAGSGSVTPGTSDAIFNVTYTGSNATSVSYTVSKGSNSKNISIGLNNLLGLAQLIPSTTTTTPLASSTDLVSTIVPFILPVSGKSDSLWTNLTTQIFPDQSVNVNSGGLSISGSVKSSITSDHFEVDVNSKISGSLSGQNADMSESASLVYELATGVLLGFKVSLSINTALQGSTISGKANIDITRSDYSFGSSGVFGFEYMPFIFSMFIVSIILLRFRRNKVVK